MNAKQVRVTILIAVAILVISTLLLLYFNFANPLKKEVETLSEKIVADTKILETVREKIAEQPKLDKEEALKLQTEVPLEPFVDKLIVDIRSIVQETQNAVENISVNYSQVTMDELINTTGTEIAATNTDEVQEGGVGALEVYKVTLNMNLESLTYDHLRQFILGIEGLERVINIDSISFSVDNRYYQVSLSIFYAPQFEAIEDRLPKANFPQPVKKSNPTASWGGTP
ncbi:hypothetical protein ACE3MQ_14590 [Paenibacillus lentus]|uniref:hypothetical protein n=1 Tax=Paenibacillus lentus TaxID=1338368 RepID=UPI00365C925E